MSETYRQMANPYLAEVIAYGEKPYIDLSMESNKSDREIETLRQLAHYAGIEAGKLYVQGITADFAGYVGEEMMSSDSETETKMDHVLDMSLSDLSEDSVTRVSLRTLNMAHRGGVGTLRDLLIMGKSRVAELRNVGKAATNELSDLIQEHCGDEIQWRFEPSVADICKLVDSLDQVSASCLSERAGGKTIAAVLQMPPEELAHICGVTQLTEDGYVFIPNYEYAEWLMGRAQEFADSFNDIKNRQGK